MSGFTKLYGSILRSSIWLEDAPTRLMWITFLALADKDGFVEGSVPGMAHTAVVSIDDARRAIEKLESPDPDSKDPDYEGRRIERVDGGWIVLNHAKYREYQSPEQRAAAVRQARHRHKMEGIHRDESQRKRDTSRKSVTSNDRNGDTASASASVSASVSVEETKEVKVTQKKPSKVTKATQASLLVLDPDLERTTRLYLAAWKMRKHPDIDAYPDLASLSEGTVAEVRKYIMRLREFAPFEWHFIASLPALVKAEPGDVTDFWSHDPTVLLRTGENARQRADGSTVGATCHAKLIDAGVADEKNSLQPNQVKILRQIGTLDYVRRRGAFAKGGW